MSTATCSVEGHVSSLCRVAAGWVPFRIITGEQHDVWTVNNETAYHEDGHHPDVPVGDRSVPLRHTAGPLSLDS